MKSFFKIVFGTITGILLMCIISFVIILIVFSPDEKVVLVKENSIIQINLTGNLRGNSQSVLDQLTNETKQLDLDDLRKFFQRITNDDKVEGVFLNLNGFSANTATTTELRSILENYKNQGGKILSYADYYGQGAYYLASISDSIYVAPGGGMDWKGLKAEVTFFKNALEKLGVDMQIIRHGKFKSAVEPFLLTEMSPSNRIQTEKLIFDIWNEITSRVSNSRNISNEELNQLADNLSLISSDDAINNGLIDKALYYPDFLEGLKSQHEIVNYSDYKVPTKSSYKKDKVAVLNAFGDIVDGQGEPDEIGGSRFVDQIEKLAEDDKIKAVVLHVNSPGGSALASDNMWNSLQRLKAKKSLVVYMSDYAASGGYYISACADSIFASPTTITGSIGVFGMIPNAKKLVEDKLGVNVDVAKTNKHSDVGSIFNPLDDYEREQIQQSVETIYDNFIGVVAEGRGMTKAEVDSIGQGRVWSGVSAIEIGLVDQLGTLQDAIDCAARRAELDEYVVRTYPEQKSLEEKIMQALTGEEIKKMQLSEEATKYLDYIDFLCKNSGVLARPAYFLEIK